MTRFLVDLDRETEVFLRYAIVQWIEDALLRLARKVAQSEDPEIRSYLMRDYTVAVNSGTALLSNAQYQGQSVTEPIFYDTIDPRNVTHPSSTYAMQWVPNQQMLSLPRPTAFLYYTVYDGKILTRDLNGSTTGLTGTISFTANYLPLLS